VCNLHCSRKSNEDCTQFAASLTVLHWECIVLIFIAPARAMKITLFIPIVILMLDYNNEQKGLDMNLVVYLQMTTPTVDIVALIESNPMTRFTGEYQSRMATRIQETFTNTQQHLFLSSCYCYLNYDKNDFVIDLDDIWEWMGFSKKANAKRCLEKYFVLDKDYTKFMLMQEHQDTPVKSSVSTIPKGSQCETDDKQTSSNQTKAKHGGSNRHVFKITVSAFKRFCLKAGTEKADEIHDYYIKLEEIVQETVREESIELQNQLVITKENLAVTASSLETSNVKIDELSTNINQTAENSASKLLRDKEEQKQSILLTEFTKSCSLVYVIRVKSYANGVYIIKIGESRCGIVNRYAEHKRHYPECMLLDVFQVDNSKGFETLIHEHNDIRPSRARDLAGYDNELELFTIGRQLSYRTLTNVISHNIKYFNNTSTRQYMIEIEMLKTQLEMKNTHDGDNSVTASNDTINRMADRMTTMENNISKLIEMVSASNTRICSGFNTPLVTVGPRLQKINPETMELLHVYETVTELMRENESVKRPSINKAVKNNTIYAGFRWNLVDRDFDATVVGKVGATVKTIVKNPGYIARLNLEKTQITHVFIDRKVAAKHNGMPPYGLDSSIKSGKVANGWYYKLYADCDVDVRSKFESVNTEGNSPMLYNNGIGQYDGSSKLVREFACKYDCIRQLRISDKTLARSLIDESEYQGHFYRHMPPRTLLVGGAAPQTPHSG